MLTLNDGRSELWQWDTGRKLTVDADFSQVHFSNKIFGRSIDVDVVDGVAIIPDVLLQTDKDLFAWAFVGTSENGYTKISKVFKVNKRNKPADYVFTPTEQTTLSEIMERLDRIQESQDPDAIKNAVDDYLANNPIEIDETDPTVPNWAKQPTKPSYTASEVGALPAGTVIPTIPDNVSAFRNDAGYLTEHQDLTGYATEKYVQGYAQPKGDYLTEVPDAYATKEFVTNKIAEAELGGEEVDLSGYAQKSELPTKVSQLENDSGYLTEHQDISGKLDANKLPEAINTALAQAKASGEFDGKDGQDGYTPQKNVDYFDGQPGKDGYTPVKGIDYWTEADKTEMVEAVKESLDSIPSYWQTHLNLKIALIREAMLSVGANKSAFFFYSDSHWSNDTTYTAKMAPTLLKYLCEHTPINKVNFGGDIVNAEANDSEVMAYLWDWRSQLYGLNHHSVPGNHDDGNTTDNLFSENYVYGYLLAPEETADIVRGDEGMYYYIDNPAEKTRYLYLDTAYKGVTEAEQTFVQSALLSTPENWHIIAIAHAWFENDYTVYPPVLNGWDAGAKILLDMFDRYNARNDEFEACSGWVEFCVGGHYHLDHVAHTDGGIPVIIVEADTLHNRGGSMPQKGTTDESAVSAVIADYNTNTVKIIRVGRGEDYNAKIEIKTVSYTNVIPLSIDKDGNIFNGGKGWADNSRIGSGGIYLGNGTHYVTGHIEIDPNIDNVFRLRNMTFDSTTSNSYAYGMVTFDSSFARAKYDGSADVLYSDTDLAANTAVWDTVIEGNNIVQFTLKASAITNKNIKYVAICCSGISDDSIITINEPID